MNKEAKKTIFGIILLILTAFIWGNAFVAQKDAMDHIGPLTMNGARSILAAVFLLPVALIVDKIKGKKVSFLGTSDKVEKKNLIVGGLSCGLLITLASTIQQYGVKYTTVGKSGFLTTLYIIFVPLLGLFLGKRVHWNGWVAVALAGIGMFLICIGSDIFVINQGDLLVIFSALFFAIHILVVDKYTVITDGIRLSFFQFAICGIVCGIGSLIFEKPQLSDILNAWFPIFFAGVLSAGVGYTLQIIAQKWVPPHITPIVMSLESVFSLLAGAVLRHEKLMTREYIGCSFMFVAIIIAQITFKSKKPSEKVKKENKKFVKANEQKQDEISVSLINEDDEDINNPKIH